MYDTSQTLSTHRQYLERMLRRREVEAITGLSKSAIYAGMAAGSFPPNVKLSRRAVAWPESSIRAFLAERMEGGVE